MSKGNGKNKSELLKEPVTQIEITHNLVKFGYAIRMLRTDERGVKKFAKPMEFSKPYVQGQMLPKDGATCMELSKKDLQHLMNNLWEVGIRPDVRYTMGDIAIMTTESNELMRKLMVDVRKIRDEPKTFLQRVGALFTTTKEK